MKYVTLLFVFVFTYMSNAQEICDNGIDDDNDGFIDLNDKVDCKCVFSNATKPSSIPNHSFEIKSGCPLGFTEMNLVESWIQASRPTSDFYDTCGFKISDISGNIILEAPRPIPNGSSYVGFHGGFYYKEYVGVCLLDTLYQGASYSIELQIAFGQGDTLSRIAIFGTNKCNNLPFGIPNNSYFGCPTNGLGWEILDVANTKLELNKWSSVKFTFTPKTDVTTIVLGPSCEFDSIWSYYYIDNLILNAYDSINEPVFIEQKNGSICDSNIILSVSYNGRSPNYQWYKNGIALVGETNSYYSFANTDSGNYQVKVLTDSGCVISSIYKNKIPNIQIENTTSSDCTSNEPNGIIEVLKAYGGVKPYLYNIDNGTFYKDTTFMNLRHGEYLITVKDSNGCIGEKYVRVDSFYAPNIVLKDTFLCEGDTITLSTNEPGEIIWQDELESNTYKVTNAGLYWVEKRDSVCFSKDTMVISSEPYPSVSLGKDSFLCIGDSMYLYAYSNETNFTWNDNSNSDNLKIKASGNYFVEVSNLCGTARDSILIESIDCGCETFLPTSFTPNNDGRNDIWKLITQCELKSYNLMIFNRWGEHIYESTDIEDGWDGTYVGKEVPQGAYLIVVNYTTVFNHQRNKSAVVTLLK